MTPSITKTLNKERTSKSESMTEERKKETKNRMKKVMISSNNKVISNHSENIRKATERRSQTVSIIFVAIGKVLEEQNTEKLLLKASRIV